MSIFNPVRESQVMLMLWPILWILAMVGLIMATIIAGVREKKARAKAAPQGMTPMQMNQDEAVSLDGNVDSFDDGFGATDDLGDDPFK